MFILVFCDIILCYLEGELTGAAEMTCCLNVVWQGETF